MAAGTGLAAAATTLSSCKSARGKSAKKPIKGRINQSVAYWPFAEYWDLDKTCQIAKQLGCKSVELVDPSDFPTLRKHGLVCAITPNGMGDPPFVRGFNNPQYHEEIIASTKESIDASAAYGFPNVIGFTGFEEDIPDHIGKVNCVAGFKEIVGYAEKKGVNICLEILNTRVAEEMKGHPGYQGDHVDYCMDIIKAVGSPRMKILFDIYHIQIMDGDIITRIRECKDYIGHVHTAGNPGRCEIDDRQEINYRPIMEELVRIGYDGYVGHEFIPTGDPFKGLQDAVRICNV